MKNTLQNKKQNKMHNENRHKRKKLYLILTAEVIVMLLLFLVVFPEIRKIESVNEQPEPSAANTGSTELLTQAPDNHEDAAQQITPEVIPSATESPSVPSAVPEDTDNEEADSAKQQAEDQKAQELQNRIDEELKISDRLAAMYEYDAAIEYLQNLDIYEDTDELYNAVNEYMQQKESCTIWEDNTKITHIFFHSLIVDTSLAFGPKSKTATGYNLYMTTTGEFEKILEALYEEGYVLVSMHDIASVVTAPDKTEQLEKNEILLPEGKQPLVISEDDVCYYDYMDGEGFADKIVLDDNGKPTCEYIEKDGSVVTGEYDLVPILDRFVEEHPDFSYKGAKALLCITGYEGALGYETQPDRYNTSEKLNKLSDQEKTDMLASEQAACTKVAAALREDGYDFASHSYGHRNVQTCTYDKLVYDTERWEREVGSLLGGTDIYVYPFGADIGDWHAYSGEKYEYLKSMGFWYFCNVDSSVPYWVVITDDYMRMGRINCDGEMMQLRPQVLDFLYDSEAILDVTRPALIKGEDGSYENADYSWTQIQQ